MSSPEWVRAGRMLRTRGRHGEFLAEIDNTKPGRAEAIKRGLLRLPERETPFEVEQFWVHDGRPVYKLAGIDSISEAEPWEHAEILVAASDRAPIEEGEFYFSDLIGCRVEDASGMLGTVTALEEGAGPLLLRVEQPTGGELLVPFVRAICREIDTVGKRIAVELPDGLADL